MLTSIVVDLQFKSVAGHTCLFIQISCCRKYLQLNHQNLVDNLLTSENLVSEIGHMKETIHKHFFVSSLTGQDCLK